MASGKRSDVERLVREVSPEVWAPLCVLLHERIAWHGCRYIKPDALRGMLRIAYPAAPAVLAREAGGREALAEIFAFAGLPAPWDRRNRQTPTGEGRP
ncbi:hypothetical protein [Halomonas mongoliensis]|uniref:hypothetical protein n=1 Tax=Halomonas mongoliensis TaxID=321265 RepID=UPI00403A896E